MPGKDNSKQNGVPEGEPALANSMPASMQGVDAAKPGMPVGDKAEWLETAVQMLPGAITQLPAQQQLVVIGHYFHERSVSDLAEDLRVHPLRVRSLLQVALRTLRRQVPQ